jgi:hypothetical protein
MREYLDSLVKVTRDFNPCCKKIAALTSLVDDYMDDHPREFHHPLDKLSNALHLCSLAVDSSDNFEEYADYITAVVEDYAKLFTDRQWLCDGNRIEKSF